MDKKQQQEIDEHKKGSHGGEKHDSEPGSSGSGAVRVRSNTPENRRAEMNPSAPTESTEGPSTNLADEQRNVGSDIGTTRREPARGESKANEGTIKKPLEDKHDAA